MELDPQLSAVRTAIYECFVHAGRAPTIAELGAAVPMPLDQLRRTLGRLAELHAIVMRREADAIWMAAPFSGVPTAFLVTAEEPGATAGAWWANCAWDALGIPAALAAAGLAVARAPMRVSTLCSDCGEPLTLVVRPDVASPEDAVRLEGADDSAAGPVLHFAVPASRWWDDIGFT